VASLKKNKEKKMSTGLIIWLLVLVVLNICLYGFWLNIKDATGTGGLGDGLVFIFFAAILAIADVSTFISIAF
jgi:hypothetical protein